MNRKQLGILLVLVVVVGGAGLIISKKRNQARSAGNVGIGQKVFATLPVNDVTHVRISEGTNELNLVKKDDAWRVAERSDYPANFSQLSEFMRKARDLKAVQSEQIGPSQLGRLKLAIGQGTNAPTVVEFKSGDKVVGTLLLGKMHMSARGGQSQFGGMEGGWPDGRYVATTPNPTSMALVSETFDNVEAKPESWLNKDLFRVEKPRSIEVVFPEATNSWKLTRESESADWKLADAKEGEKLDSAMTAGVTYPFSSVSFNDVIRGDAVSASGTNQPTLINIETFDGFSYAVKVGAKTNEAFPLVVSVKADFLKERKAAEGEKPEDKEKLDKEFHDAQQKLADKLKQEQSVQGWTYLVSTWSVEPVLKARHELIEDKKAEESAAEGASATVESDSPAETPAATVSE